MRYREDPPRQAIVAENTTKVCPKCGCTNLIEFTSQNIKMCIKCKPYTYIRWDLEPKQKSLFH